MGRKNFYCVKTSNLNQDTLLQYKEVLSRWPYCQYAHLAFLLNLQKTGDEVTYKEFLPQAAICLPDRVRLKEHVKEAARWKDERPATPETPQKNTPSAPAKPAPKFSPFQDSLPMKSGRDEFFTPVIEPAPVPATVPARTETTRPKTSRPEVSVDKVRSLISRPQTDAIIDRFMQGHDGASGEHFITVDENFDYNSFDPDTGGSSVEDFSFGSETLAEMYLKNGSPEKAIAVYKNLGLKFPEKSVYFANLIKKVKREYRIK